MSDRFQGISDHEIILVYVYNWTFGLGLKMSQNVLHL